MGGTLPWPPDARGIIAAPPDRSPRFVADSWGLIRANDAAEALDRAKQQGKVRYVGFTGHKDPAIHLKVLATGFPFDAVQMPLNAFDATFHSFETQVLPELNRRGIAALGMKPFSGQGRAAAKGPPYPR
jgi:predicted aldo/keto reductase-like oxidoreductase